MIIDNETKVISSIAIKQSSLGAAMHNSGFRHLGLNFVYIPLTVADCKNAVAGIRALNFRGSTVSMPHKQEVIKYLDKIDPVAKKIGAVNTISNESGVLTGYNSDWIGAIEALKEVTKLKNRVVCLIGAGGAARAISYGLKENKSDVVIFDRTVSKAMKLSKTFDLRLGGDLENLKKFQEDYDILINATSVGFYPNTNDSIVDKEMIQLGKVAMDVVFNPRETLFLKYAKTRKCSIVPGYRMLIHQALFQFELFTGRKPPFKVMEHALLKNLKK